TASWPCGLYPLSLHDALPILAESPTTQITEGLAFLAGVYLAISPWVVGFSNLSTITINNLVIGVAVALLALGFASAFGRTHGLRSEEHTSELQSRENLVCRLL